MSNYYLLRQSLSFAAQLRERMGAKIASFIIRNRIYLLIALAFLTGFMAYHARQVKLAYDFPQVVPPADEDFQHFQNFKEKFGADGNYIVIGTKSDDLFELDFFNNWLKLERTIDTFEHVNQVTSLADVTILEKNKARRKFEPTPLLNELPGSQNELDSIVEIIQSQPFYRKLFYNPETQATYIAINIDPEILNSKERQEVISQIKNTAEAFGKTNDVEMHYSGIPFIRTNITQKVKKELTLFSVLAIVIVSIFLLIFFRSPYAVVFPLVVIGIIIITSLGTIDLLGYEISILTSLIPPLIAIIGVPNFIYFLNKYHNEFHKHGNKMRAITRMVQKIGIVTFLTNFTTAIGFGVLAFTDSPVLKEFGIVASLNVAATFIVSIIVIPVVFSYLPQPSYKQTKYLDNKLMRGILDKLTLWVINYRKRVYAVAGIIVITAIFGLTNLKAVGFILDDIPQDDELYQDLKFFEKHFNGILPFEITVNTGERNGLYKISNLEKLSELQDTLDKIPVLSKNLSIADVVKLSRQAYYNGNEERYGLPSKREINFILPYIRRMQSQSALSKSMMDSLNQTARISTKIEDIGSIKLRSLMERLNAAVDSIYKESEARVEFTGISLIFLKNNKYLIQSLIYSLILAFILVSIIMGLLFGKVRMIVISLVPNFIPLMVTAGIMGYFGIPLKPSTVLVFSIAFGISVDDALHFLAKYRQELLHHSWDIEKTVKMALKETGLSMIYTSLVLFFGFAIFFPSSFGGTSSLGLLTSITLLVAMVTNVILLPSLLLSFDKKRKKS